MLGYRSDSIRRFFKILMKKKIHFLRTKVDLFRILRKQFFTFHFGKKLINLYLRAENKYISVSIVNKSI